MNYTSASTNIKNSIEKHDLPILAVMLVFAYMNSSSSSSSKAMLAVTVVVIRISVTTRQKY